MILLPGSIIAGKFRLERPLAQGGMGSVWVAFNTQLEVPVALKFMAPALVSSAELVSRFEREAKGAAQLRNPHVVQIFEHGLDQGTPYIAMELLEGEDLGARLRARGRLSLQETARILGDVCKALRRAHDMGLVHRDLKPANIFLCAHDEYEIVKVLDFGIAKSVSASAQGEATKTGALVGSPHYMSPEQARRTNKQVDHRADLWAVGVIAFRCLTGRLPYPGDDVIDVLVRVCTEPVPVPSTLAPDLGPEVDRFFARALTRDPDGRFQSAKEMADALSALAGLPGKAALPGLDRSWSDVQVQVQVPPPRPSDRGGGRGPAAPVGEPAAASVLASSIAAGLDEGDAFDVAKTLPLAHPSAQRAIEGRPWAATAKLPAVGAPAEPAAGGTEARGPVSSPDLPRMDPSAAPAGHQAVGPTFFQPAQGTLTSAGAEVVGARGPAQGRERSWVALVAALAVVVVLGVVIGATVLTGKSGDEASLGETGGDTATSGLASAAAAEPARAEAPGTPVPGAATSGASSGAGVAAPSSSEPAPAAAAPAATAMATTTATAASAASTPSGSRSSSGTGAAGPKSPPAGTKPPSGYLGKPKF